MQINIKIKFEKIPSSSLLLCSLLRATTPVTPSSRRSNSEEPVMVALRLDCFGLRPRNDGGRIGCNNSNDLLFLMR
jgi:hypothetical protein